MRWIWGLVFIAIGGALLAQNFSWWSNIDFHQLLIFWPLLLVLLGVSLLLRGKKFSEPIMAILVLISLLSMGYYLANHKNEHHGINDGIVATNNISEDLPADIEEGKVAINTGAITMSIKEGTDKFIEGKLDSNVFEPRITKSTLGKVFNFELDTDVANTWFDAKPKNNLDLNITNKIPVLLQINAGASTLDLDLSKLKLKGLNLDSGASTINIKLGSEIIENANVDLGAGASKITIAVPKDLGVNLVLNASLSNKKIDNFDKVSDMNYKSKEYDKAAKKIDMRIDAGVSTIEITTY